MTGDTSYLILSALWSLGGLAVGYILGRSAGTNSRHRLISWETLSALLVVGVVAAGVGMFVKQATDYADQAKTLQRVAACQAEQGKVFREAIIARSDAQQGQLEGQIEQNNAQLTLLTTPRQSDPAAGLAAIQRYVKAVQHSNDILTELKTTRAQNPLPDLSCEAP